MWEEASIEWALKVDSVVQGIWIQDQCLLLFIENVWECISMLRAASSLKWWSLLERLGCSASWLARGLLLLLAVTDTQCKCPMGRLLDCSWTVGGPYLLPQISFPVFRPLGHEVAGILLAVLSSQMRPCWWSLTGVPSCWWNLDLQSCWCSGVPCPGIGWVTSSVSSWLISPATFF